MNRSATALVKALEAAGYAPGVFDETSGCWVRVINPDPATGHIRLLSAHWGPDGDTSFTVLRHGDMVRLVGYRALVAEVKTGARAETAEDRVCELLGGLYVRTERIGKVAEA